MFNPNKAGMGEWATYLNYRSPKFKVHQTRGHATLAIKYGAHSTYENGVTTYTIARDAKLYKREGAEWVEVNFKRVYHHTNEEII